MKSSEARSISATLSFLLSLVCNCLPKLPKQPLQKLLVSILRLNFSLINFRKNLVSWLKKTLGIGAERKRFRTQAWSDLPTEKLWEEVVC